MTLCANANLLLVSLAELHTMYTRCNSINHLVECLNGRIHCGCVEHGSQAIPQRVCWIDGNVCSGHSIEFILNERLRMQIQSRCQHKNICTLIVKDNEWASELQIWLQSFFKSIMNETMLNAQKSCTHIPRTYKHTHTDSPCRMMLPMIVDCSRFECTSPAPSLLMRSLMKNQPPENLVYKLHRSTCYQHHCNFKCKIHYLKLRV